MTDTCFECGEHIGTGYTATLVPFCEKCNQAAEVRVIDREIASQREKVKEASHAYTMAADRLSYLLSKRSRTAQDL